MFYEMIYEVGLFVGCLLKCFADGGDNASLLSMYIIIVVTPLLKYSASAEKLPSNFSLFTTLPPLILTALDL